MIFEDSKAALQVIDFPGLSRLKIIDDGINLLRCLSDHEKFVLQWMPAHCAVKENESADYLAKKRSFYFSAK